MKKPYKNTELSDRRCQEVGCSRFLKKNLLTKKPQAKFCYRCFYPKEMKRRGINVHPS